MIKEPYGSVGLYSNSFADVFYICVYQCLYVYLTCTILHLHHYTHLQYQVIWTGSYYYVRPEFV